MLRAFISFDFDHDEDLKNALNGQAKNDNSPFEIANWSLKEPLTGNWQRKIEDRITQTSVVIVICGRHTHTADGVSIELNIARKLKKPYFLLRGRKEGGCNKPKAAATTDKVYDWTWDNLKILLNGGR